MTDHRPIDVALENRLMSHGIYVTECVPLSEDDGTIDEGGSADDLPDGTGLALEYETVSESSGVDSQEVGAVVRTLLDVAGERDWAPGRLEATSLTTDGTVRGRWHVERAWFDGLGLEIDDVEFSQRVLETIRTDAVHM
ncbi:hypothetical protein [Natronorubrum thiooxidans]|uniref:DUF8159 domain-containing protein n=1 Tax=Natronorubrum thiooxidans TaxID=308853 RepID=A0A1N7EN21_9EURY|nr:hypothetical protein [Natronorubrum thiooxidans]SIR89473.1 hypothetical protein SAMN05421752_104273 [Natronorubrum thiooxidans]